MKLTPLGIEGAWLAESPIWKDERGFFREWFKAEEIRSVTGIDFSIQQANISQSQRGVLRGIHYSLAPSGQAKWITCVTGSIQDVIVDIRPKSKTFGKWIDVELEAASGEAVFIGEGLGHGFLALENDTTVAYLVSTQFSPKDEFEINPLDLEIGINWKIDPASLKISEKDKIAPWLSARLDHGKLP
jgi:dTDP-4-dehydrorhamnose 3,5-epimerase